MEAGGVYRVGMEIENIGERVAASKKRVLWRLTFEGSETVHTVTLEHSRLTAKKRVKVDGKQIYKQDTFTNGDWTFEFYIENQRTAFVVLIRDVKSAYDSRNLDAIYDFCVGKEMTPFAQLPERKLAYEANRQTDVITNRWGRDSYARKISTCCQPLDMNEIRITWVFTFGVDGEIHKLVLDCINKEEKVVVLDRREIHRTGHYTNHQTERDLATSSSSIQHDGIHESTKKCWSFQHNMVDGHHLEIWQDPSEAVNNGFVLKINGSVWNDIDDTDFVLQPDWDPVQSKSTGKVYYRNDTMKITQWRKPVISRNEVSNSSPPQYPSTRIDNQPMPSPPANVELPKDVSTTNDTPGVDLLDLSEEGVTTKSSSTKVFDPLSMNPPANAQESASDKSMFSFINESENASIDEKKNSNVNEINKDLQQLDFLS